jgi:hypothetical protein
VLGAAFKIVSFGGDSQAAQAELCS